MPGCRVVGEVLDALEEGGDGTGGMLLQLRVPGLGGGGGQPNFVGAKVLPEVPKVLEKSDSKVGFDSNVVSWP